MTHLRTAVQRLDTDDANSIGITVRALPSGVRQLLALSAIAVGLTACGGSGDSTGDSPGNRGQAGGWIRVEHTEETFGGDDEQVMRAVTVGGPGFVAVGWDGVGGDRDAAIWTSTDGLSWNRVPHEEAVFGGPDAQLIASVTQGGPGLVAVGLDGSGGDFDAAVWVSADGLSWERVPHDELSLGGINFQAMQDVASSGSRLVAAGADTSGGDFDAATWFSDDGRSWTRVADAEDLFGGSNEQDINAVAAGGPGFVAAGFDESAAFGDRDVAIWTSTDGEEWARVPHDEVLFGGAEDQVVLAVEASEGGLVAVGYDEARGDRDAAVWRSDDGLDWSRSGNDAFPDEGHQMIMAVAINDAGLHAVGRDAIGAVRWGALWSSTDGVDWQRVPSSSVFEGEANGPVMFGIDGRDGSLVVIGVDGSGGDDDAAVWVYRG